MCVYGYGNTGNTYLWKSLIFSLQSQREIVLTVASSSITSLLLTGGRIAHSQFAIPLIINENSTCNIIQNMHCHISLAYKATKITNEF